MRSQSEGWLFEAPPGARRRPSAFTAKQVRWAFRQAQRLGAEPAPPDTTVRSKRSESARHRDQLRGVHGHHAFPKYLGGLRRQILAWLPADLHYLYHQEVDRLLRLPRAASGRYRSLSRAEKVAILRRLAGHARSFDARYGTSILARLRGAVRDAIARGAL